MQDSSKETVLELLRRVKPKVILDAPSGNGWLANSLGLADTVIDGIDLFTGNKEGYRNFVQADLDRGLPGSLGEYDCIVSCEGIEHFANPGLFFDSADRHLQSGGLLLVTTPNVWYPESKLQFLFRGFFPGFPCLVGRIERGSHMHIMPWSFPHLYLFLRLSGFVEIELHREPLSKARHWWEYAFGWPQKLYCLSRKRKAKTDDEKIFWETAASTGSVFGRHLIVSARKAS